MSKHQAEKGLHATVACGRTAPPAPEELPDLWQEALAAGDTKVLLRLNGYHFARFPRFAPVFGDLTRELRFSDLAGTAQAAFILEAVRTLDNEGQEAGRAYCRGASTLLENEYARRHYQVVSVGGRYA